MALYRVNYNAWVNLTTLWHEGEIRDLDPFDKLGLCIVYAGLLSPWEATPGALAARTEMPMPEPGSFMYQAARACVHRIVQPESPAVSRFAETRDGEKL